MLAILGGAGAAICFAAATLAATVAARELGAGATLAWVGLIGTAMLILPLALFASIDELRGDAWWQLTLAALCNVVGLRLLYFAFTRGPVGVITAIASTEGAVVTVIALVAGAHIEAGTLVLLVLVSVGVALIALRPEEEHHRLGSALPVVLVVPVLFGSSLYLVSKGTAHGAALWAALAPRLAAAILVAAPLAFRRELRLPRRLAPVMILAAAGEVLGFLSYVLGARHGVAVSAVLTSQYVGLAVLGGYLFFGETLARRQLLGVGITVFAVAALAATSG
jgi:drug/metabolite transporter (DMT)-like permease